jgi:glycosyltransferase involved in cell wall biosynthesis
MKLPISAIILTYNEEKNIKNCLESLYVMIGDILIVDSGSTDKTLDIARQYTDKIYYHPFHTHAEQWNWAFRNLPFSYEWCLVLDADQSVTSGLMEELREVFRVPPSGVGGYYINRRQIFRGKWIRFGGYYPKYLLRLFKIKEVYCDERELVDKRFYVKGRTQKLKHDIIEENLKENDISFWVQKHNRYSDLLAQEELCYRKNQPARLVKPAILGNPDQRTLWLKGLYYKLPLYVRPFVYFFWRYFICLGFLDGGKGFLFHFLQGFWYRLIIDMKIHELKKISISVDMEQNGNG